MKKQLLTAVITLQFYLCAAQTNDWVYRTNYETTNEKADSTYNYTNVYIELNPAVLTDSAEITLTIGSAAGSADIYSKKYIFTPFILSEKDVKKKDKSYQFYLGKYVIRDTPFVVDLSIQGPRHN
jgi:hypothetical protein